MMLVGPHCGHGINKLVLGCTQRESVVVVGCDLNNTELNTGHTIMRILCLTVWFLEE